ncbi:DUF2975 domain-containing protein [Tenacibaculum tangerinum]|uniref:DUF2975 domain-containing protein n=1 Tax=Tenacibaculum tangerinum TaxID=3038772 RepID=A0ABY8L6G5_9FLAO|nr:DUF2975 domain-containing protein [Tenacibaculum tangerinum]WGH76232.1 DUF2975 domain-containing protein [Tenacibaculum tangerinum]
MDTPKTLFSTLNAFIFLIIIAISFGLMLTILSAFGTIPDSMFKSEVSFPELDWVVYLFMTLNLIVYGVFVYGLFKLRKVSKLFLNGTFYDLELGKNCSLAGKSFILSGVFWCLFDGLSSIYFKNEFSIGVSDKTFIYLFFIVMGLFLMLTSKLFDRALELKKENDLTI